MKEKLTIGRRELVVGGGAIALLYLLLRKRLKWLENLGNTEVDPEKLGLKKFSPAQYEFQIDTTHDSKRELLELTYPGGIAPLFIRNSGPVAFGGGGEIERYPGEVLNVAENNNPILEEVRIREDYLKEIGDEIGLYRNPGKFYNISDARIGQIVPDVRAYTLNHPDKSFPANETYFIVRAITAANPLAFPEEPQEQDKKGNYYTRGCLVFRRERNKLVAIGWVSSIEPFEPTLPEP